MKLNLENYTDGFFEVNHINGFLPLKSPLAKLPSRYSEVQALIYEMPIKKADEQMDCYLKEGQLKKE